MLGLSRIELVEICLALAGRRLVENRSREPSKTSDAEVVQFLKRGNPESEKAGTEFRLFRLQWGIKALFAALPDEEAAQAAKDAEGGGGGFGNGCCKDVEVVDAVGASGRHGATIRRDGIRVRKTNQD